jgi:hypothetical protein
MDAQGARFVTRLKTNTLVETTAELPADEAAGILSYRIGLLPKRLASQRQNPFQDPVREIVVRIDTGKNIRLVTNDLDAPASEIAALYKQRWQIELFFKWIKQNLKIHHFLGTSENAVRIQVFVALIAYLLLRKAQACQDTIAKPLAFARLIRLNIMHQRPINAIHESPQHQNMIQGSSLCQCPKVKPDSSGLEPVSTSDELYFSICLIACYCEST